MSVKNSRGLGRGLDALIPIGNDNVSTSDKPEGNFLNVPVNSIEPNPVQPRQTFNDESLADLAESIKENGIIQPLIVVKSGSGYELIAGERRLRAAKVLGLSEVPVIVRDGKELKKLELALVENIQRDNLNAIEEALAYQKLMGELSLTQEEVAGRVGKSRSQIANKIRLLSLPVEIKRALNTGQISEGHARALLAIINTEQQILLLGLIISRKLSVRETEKKVSEVISGQKLKKDKVESDPDVAQIEKELSETLGSKVTIRPKRKGGSITINYDSDEDRERIIGFFMKGN